MMTPVVKYEQWDSPENSEPGFSSVPDLKLPPLFIVLTDYALCDNILMLKGFGGVV